MILAIYLTGCIVMFMCDLTIDISVKGCVFNKRWVFEMFLSFSLWPLTIVMNILMAIFLRSKGKYTFLKTP